ncbi:MAG: YkgJ family cysteine cluster protein [Bdellovibrionota bacterium]
MPKQAKWWSEGIRFECQGSGKCCTSRGGFGYVYLTLDDRRRMAKHLGLATRSFTVKYCKKIHGQFALKEEKGNPDCVFLEGKKCSVYAARPTQCRTWPFWPESMQPKAWRRDVAAFCPGVGKGRLISAREIQQQIDIQNLADG